MYKSRKSCDDKWFIKRIFQLFKRRYTPAEIPVTPIDQFHDEIDNMNIEGIGGDTI